MDRKSTAFVVGASIGAAAIAVAIGYQVWRECCQHQTLSVNEAVEKARDTVRQLNDALDAIKGSS